MSSDGSDIELPSALPKKTNKKMPKSPSEDLLKKNQDEDENESEGKTQDPKKLTTKIMIQQALIDLKSRKGVSMYAIKKYLTEKYNVNTDKLNYIIKKNIKMAVEEGTIIQLKGVGATGSFKLAPVKENKKSKPKKPKIDKDGKEKVKKPPKKKKESSKKTAEKAVKSKTKSTETKSKEEKPEKSKKKVEKEKVPKQKNDGAEKEKKVKIKAAKVMKTPAKKKAAMMKRKSIGSIIKPPKMKPKTKA